MAETDAPILVEEDQAMVRITLNRPKAGNSLSMDLVEALRASLTSLAPREEIKVIILKSAHPRIFSAGHDLNEFHKDPTPEFLEADFAGITALMQMVMAQPQIMIAQVDGVATAAGLELMAACDLAFASTTSRFAVPGVNIGFWCHTPQVALSRSIGPKQAMMMLATGKLFPADYALSIGLVNELHEPEKLDAAVHMVATLICSKAASVLRHGKRSFRQQLSLPLADAYAYVKTQALENIAHKDAREGIAAFLEKRDPHWEK